MHDVADCDSSDATLATYEQYADRYIERTSTVPSVLVDDLISLTGPAAVVLELGSGPGRDALALEAAGLIVHRTDGAVSFVNRLHQDGFRASVLNVLTDDFGGPFDAIFANAVLLHVPRGQLQSVLATALRATRVDGVLVASFKKGVGDEWSVRKLDAPRRFTYWQEKDLQHIVRAAGWTPIHIFESTAPKSSERWITLTARNSSQ